MSSSQFGSLEVQDGGSSPSRPPKAFCQQLPSPCSSCKAERELWGLFV